jgi:DNA ligase (NAD+)
MIEMTTAVDISEADAEAYARELNARYRGGHPIVTDAAYDAMKATYAEQFPNNKFFAESEVESDLEAIEGKTVTLPQKMLSTDKAYSIAEIEKWATDVLAVASQMRMGESEVVFRVTPKLDGFAAYNDGKALYTRGNGVRGTDITRAFHRGLIIRREGAGEIVVNKEYFEEELAPYYKNTRNIIAGVIKEGELDERIKNAVAYGAVVFCTFSEIHSFTKTKTELLRDLELMWDEVVRDCEFDTDGLVIEAVHPAIKEEMGATNHHHRWQIAYKKNEEFFDIPVLGLIWQTAKTGRLTPVVHLEPTEISGATVSKATGHNFGNVMSKMIDAGAIVRVCRSGLVIPYIVGVVKGAEAVYPPEACPSCGAPTEVDGDNLFCSNTIDCPAQVERTIEFFFKTLGNIDGFGPKVIEQLNSAGYNSVRSIYAMDVNDFDEAGFGGKTSENLFNELSQSILREIEDWRFLASFSLNNIGKGGCEKLLRHHKLADVFALTVEDIIKIDGFAELTAEYLVSSLAKIKPEFDWLMRLGFNLSETPLTSETVVSGSVAGKSICFTGTMVRGSRDEMTRQAKALGANVGSSVSSKTDYLVCGANVGAAKTNAAVKHGVVVLTEDEYLEMIK